MPVSARRMYTLGDISGITGSKLQGDARQTVDAFFYDSRAYLLSGNSLFIALESERNDGHRYIPALAERGLKAFLVREGAIDTADYAGQDVSFIIAASPLRAIQQLAAAHRLKFDIPVIGITGSNGKTIVKEWLYQLLKPDHTICRSPRSYNSQIGVPLSVLNLREGHTLGIFEAGISLPGEMAALERIIRPVIGVLTSFGSAHDEGFRSAEEKLTEKFVLFEHSDTVVLNGIDKHHQPAKRLPQPVFISTKPGADMVISETGGKSFLSWKDGEMALDIPFTDAASVSNAATCVAVMLRLGYQPGIIAQRLTQLQGVALRLELRNAIHHSLLINDFYNSDLDSLKIALNYLERESRRSRKIVIVSDIEQSGIPAKRLYGQIAALFAQHRLDLVIGIGREISGFADQFPKGSLFFSDTAQFTAQFRQVSVRLGDATILLKGARSFGFERISGLLQLKSHQTVFEINLNRLTDNINYYRTLAGPAVKLMCMVKAAGYGSGSAEIARTLEHSGVSYLAVAYADEGVELRESLVNLPVMVMSPEEGAFEDIIRYSLEPEIYSLRVLQSFVAALDRQGIVSPYPVHLKIDTGMHRLGFEEKDLPALITALKAHPQLKIVSVFSHLAAADNSELDAFTHEQLRVFEKACRLIEGELEITTLKHICNSAGTSRFPQAHYDMVRLGIGMYGIGSGPAEQKQLQNVGSLKTRISQIKQIGAGETVGYNRSGRIVSPASIAIIPIGYADGFSRLLGNGKHGVYIQGIFCKTIGNICMDMCMVDVTGLSCREGDEVVVFENAGQIGALAAAMNTIPYEVLTNVSARVRRVYVQE